MTPIEYDKCGRMKYNSELHKKQGISWSKEDLKYLIDWYEIIGLEEISMALERSEITVAAKIAYLRKQGKMEKGSRTKGYHNKLLKKATKNSDQSIPSSNNKNLIKNSDLLYHSLEVCQ